MAKADPRPDLVSIRLAALASVDLFVHREESTLIRSARRSATVAMPKAVLGAC
ncbi:MAG: hypothetical protein U0Q03_20505 [Acidimicrobiales bacterium]